MFLCLVCVVGTRRLGAQSECGSSGRWAVFRGELRRSESPRRGPSGRTNANPRVRGDERRTPKSVHESTFCAPRPSPSTPIASGCTDAASARSRTPLPCAAIDRCIHRHADRDPNRRQQRRPTEVDCAQACHREHVLELAVVVFRRLARLRRVPVGRLTTFDFHHAVSLRPKGHRGSHGATGAPCSRGKRAPPAGPRCDSSRLAPRVPG